jgi:phosphate transport system permease protein
MSAARGVRARSPVRRRLANALMVALAWTAVAVALLPLVQMSALVLRHALPALHWRILVTVTRGIAGGVANAIAGSALLVGLGALLAVPVGVLGGIFAGEVGRGPFVRVVRVAADVLAGVPSIAVGYFGFVALVQGLGWGFSALAGAIALAIIMLPYVFRTTDYAVSAVADDVREASLALGADRVTTARLVVVRAALPGIVTGVLLGTGVAIGETAPLLYTASWSSFMPTAHLVHSPVGYLTYVVWAYINQPFASANALAYAAALLLMVAVLGLGVLGRWAAGGRMR